MLLVVVRNLGLCFLTLGLLVGCGHELVAPGDPVSAVEGLADAMHDNDLVRYSKLGLPPELHAKIEQRWNAELALAPALTDAQRKDHARYMNQMMEPGAEAKLYARYEMRLKQYKSEFSSQWPLMRGTAQIFLMSAIQANESLTTSEREHAKAVAQAVLKWLQPEMFLDKEKAQETIDLLCQTAREIDLADAQKMHHLSMIESLEKGGIALKGLKEITQIYGADLDESLDDMEVKLVESSGNEATVEVTYPLLEQEIKFEIKLMRINGRWYPADRVNSARKELSQPISAAVAAP